MSGEDFTAKDFRTWAGSVLAVQALVELEVFASPMEAKKNVVQVVGTVSAKLGNTKAVCRKCYIHPSIFESYLEGSLQRRVRVPRLTRNRTMRGLTMDEAAFVHFLERLTPACSNRHRDRMVRSA